MTTTKTPSFKIIQIIYGSLIFGVIAFFLFTYDSKQKMEFHFDDSLKYMVPLFFVFIYFLSNFLFKRGISNIRNTDSLFTKLTKYQTANIMRAAPLEGFGFFAIVVAGSYANYYYLLLVGLAILIMLIHFPSKSKFENLLNLTMEEKSKLREM